MTGGGSGIGRALAHAFAKRGMKIVIVDINQEALKKVSDEVEEIGTEVISLVVDVSDPDQVIRLADAAYERFGKVNILCNNAGVSSAGPIQFLTLKDWDWVLSVNLFGVIHGVKAFLARMLKSKENCHIVNTASLAGLISVESGPYTASKFAVVAISELLKQQCFNTNVSVSVLCPGFVVTEILKNMEKFREEKPDLFKLTPDMQEMAKPFMDIVEKLFYSGMHPDVLAELVIKAIEKDIFYIVTHPEFIPNIKARFENIYSDTLELHGRVDKYTEKFQLSNETDLITFEHKVPNFSISYPNDWTQVNLVPTPLLRPIFLALGPGTGLSLFISISKKSQDMQLEDTPKKIIRFLKSGGNEIKIISSQQSNLKDGTPANETVIEYMRLGFTKSKALCVSVFKDNKVIRIILSSIANFYSEELKKIAYSMEFK
ncbi:MAG: SDR family NAD(P)-dependent oxidoreductase [Promethearchaeota archaeon]